MCVTERILHFGMGCVTLKLKLCVSKLRCEAVGFCGRLHILLNISMLTFEEWPFNYSSILSVSLAL